MAKRRRSSTGGGAAAASTTGATAASSSSEAGTDSSGDDHSSSSHSPTPPATVAAAAAAAAAADEDGDEDEEQQQDGDALQGAADAQEGETGEKRKRKRTRTRKKKGAAAAAAAGGEEGYGVDGDGEEAAGGGGGGGKGARAATDTVYVEGIPWTCDEGDVRDFFKGCGKITEIRMPRWQDSGRPRGYAHVAFAGTSAARAAFGKDGQYLNGRYLTVQAPQESATEKARRANRKAEQPRGCRTVFVKNLPYDVDESGVNEALSGCGRIASVRLAMWNHTRKLKGFGYVEFSTERGAETCVRTQQNLSIGGRPIVVDFETGAPKGSFRRQDGAQIKKTSADAGVGKGKAPKFKVHA